MLGVVTKATRQYKVDIGCAAPAVLPELAFEGATKRNRCTLEVRGNKVERKHVLMRKCEWYVIYL